MVPPMADRSVNYALRPTVINAAQPKAKPYVLTDGGGLYVKVLVTGSKVGAIATGLAVAGPS